MKPRVIYVLTTGDGSDGNELIPLGAYSTRAKAERAKTYYCRERRSYSGFSYQYSAQIEEWELDQYMEPG